MIKHLLTALCATALAATALAATNKKDEPLKVGSSIPSSTTLATARGQTFDLSAAAQRDRLVIVFYRGGWCPYSVEHLAGLQLIVEDLRLHGYELIAISPDQPSKILETLDKGPETYTLLSDSSMATATAFGIEYKVKGGALSRLVEDGVDIEAASGRKHHLLPKPSVYLVGTDGVIDYVRTTTNYRALLSPEAILRLAEAKALK